jgi:hypothetical protein
MRGVRGQKINANFKHLKEKGVQVKIQLWVLYY